MTPLNEPGSRFRVAIAGGGVAALECALALRDLAGSLVEVHVVTPSEELVERAMTVREPFGHARARHFALEPIVRDAGAQLVRDSLSWVDVDRRLAHLGSGSSIAYDALVVALGARATNRYTHAITIDDRALDETLEGLLQDIESGYATSVAFIAPGRMAWPLPLYELAMMTAGRAYDMGVELTTTLITPEEAPLALLGASASEAVAERLRRARVEVLTNGYAEIPRVGEVLVSPGERLLHVDRAVALPELYGPALRGLPVGQHGFLRIGQHCEVHEVDRVWAAGDCTEFPVKHGGLASQEADAAAEAIARLAAAPVEPQPFRPLVRAMLLTDSKPLYLQARITGGQGFSSEVSDEPLWSPPSKVSSRYLAPYLEQAGQVLA